METARKVLLWKDSESWRWKKEQKGESIWRWQQSNQ
jgi:hypothetical protein